jgi:hypothetical protein
VAIAATVQAGESAAPPEVQIRVYSTAKSATPAEDWILKTAQLQFFEGKTAGPVAALYASTPWLPLKADMASVLASPTLGDIEARVRPAAEAGKMEVLTRIKTGKAQSALYIRVAAEPGAKTVSRLVSGFDRPDVYIGVQVPAK